ncbi:MAG: hypothetical protein RSB96_03505, partial [Oscillospiraceae bacterium]
MILANSTPNKLEYYLSLYVNLAKKISPYELAIATLLFKNKHILNHIADKKYDVALSSLESAYEMALGSIPRNILSARIYWWAGLKSNSIDLFMTTLLNPQNKHRYPYEEVRMLLRQTEEFELLKTLDEILNDLGEPTPWTS